MGGENSAFTPTRGNLNTSELNGTNYSASPTSSVSEINVHEESVASDNDDDERLDVVGGVDLSPAVAILKSDTEGSPGPPQISLTAAERIAAWRHAELASRILLHHPRRE
jgi:hypothetical protein